MKLINFTTEELVEKLVARVESEKGWYQGGSLMLYLDGRIEEVAYSGEEEDSYASDFGRVIVTLVSPNINKLEESYFDPKIDRGLLAKAIGEAPNN